MKFLQSTHKTIFALLIGALPLLHCGRDTSPLASNERDLGTVTLDIVAPSPHEANRRASKIAVQSAALRIREALSEALLIDTTLHFQDGRLQARLDVTVGERLVELALHDGDGNLLWQASDAITVKQGATARAILALDYVGDQAPQILGLGASTDFGPVGGNFTFAATIEDIHDATDSLQVRWDFDGDGNPDTDWLHTKEAVHSFSAPGTYAVALEAMDRTGHISRMSHSVEVIALIANAGTDLQSIGTDNPVTLDGRNSTGIEGQALVYHWSQILDHPKGQSISVMGTFTDNNSTSAAQVSFQPGAGRGLYVFALHVETAGALSAADTVLVRITSQPPVASVNDLGTIEVGAQVQLQGIITDGDDENHSYRWRGEHAALLSDTTSSTPIFAPTESGEYHLSFIAIDGDPQESAPFELIIRVTEPGRPDLLLESVMIVDADGNPLDIDQINEGQEIVFRVDLSNMGALAADGFAIDITLDEAALYFYSDEAALGSASQVSYPVQWNAVAGAHIVRVELTQVVDSVQESNLDNNAQELAFTVNGLPLADAGSDSEVETGVLVQLDGSASRDPDAADALTYRWTQTDGPSVALSDASIAAPTFTPTAAGTYVFELIVNDGRADSQPDQTAVAVFPPQSDLSGTIIFSAVGKIHVINADGSGETQLTGEFDTDSFPSWSPDGRIVFSSNRDALGGIELYAMNADGSGLTQLTFNNSFNFHPAWSPDGSRIAFTSDLDTEIGGNAGFEIYVMNVDGTGLTRLTDNDQADESPVWSPDGSRIAFYSRRDGDGEIYVINADGTGLTRLTDNPAWDWVPTWSPDGSRIAFTSDRDGDEEIYLINADGTGLTQITNNEYAYDRLPIWSPDGAKIAFASDRDDDGDFEIYIMNADGTDPTLLTKTPHSIPYGWLPPIGDVQVIGQID